MGEFMTVNRAFEKAIELQTIQSDQLGILQAQAKYAEGTAVKASTKVGLEVGTWGLGGRAPTVKNADAKGFKGDLRKLFLWGPVQTEMKRRGGWWKFAAYLWEAGDTVKDIAQGGCHPVVITYEIGTFVSEVVLDVQKQYLQAQLKEIAKGHDFVLSAFISTRHRLFGAMDDLLAESRNASQKTAQKWVSKKGKGNEWFQFLMQARRDGRPEAGRRLVRSLLNRNLTDDLSYLDHLAACLYSVGVASEAFASQCAEGGMRPTNEALGFPQYEGYVSRDRQAIISHLATDVGSLVPEAKKRVEDLDTVVFNLGSLIGRSLRQ